MSNQEKKPLPLRHYDSVIEEVLNGYKLALENTVVSEVVEALKKSVCLAQLKDEFSEGKTTKQSEGLSRLAAESLNHDWETAFREGKTDWKLMPGMLSGPLEGQFLKSFVSIQRAKNVLEVGMFTGFGALAMAEALPANGKVVTLDICPYLETVVRPLLDQYPHGKKVKIMIGDAVKTMRELCSAGEKFDVVFLDADKSQYEEYLKLCFDENLLAPNGTVLVDNAYQHGRAFNPDYGETVAKKFGAYLDTRKDLHKVVIPLRDGVYMIRRLSDVEGSDTQ